MDKRINYPYAYGRLSSSLSGFALMKKMKEKGLDLKNWDLECAIQELLDQALDDLKKETHDAAAVEHEKYGS
jgi:hypothetical protein